MLPHCLLYTSCTRPEVYESDELPLRHNLMGPLLIDAAWSYNKTWLNTWLKMFLCTVLSQCNLVIKILH